MSDSYKTETILEGKDIEFDHWREDKSKQHPTFEYWFMVMKIILTYLVFISSSKDGDFEAYKCSLSALIPNFCQ